MKTVISNQYSVISDWGLARLGRALPILLTPCFSKVAAPSREALNRFNGFRNSPIYVLLLLLTVSGSAFAQTALKSSQGKPMLNSHKELPISFSPSRKSALLLSKPAESRFEVSFLARGKQNLVFSVDVPEGSQVNFDWGWENEYHFWVTLGYGAVHFEWTGTKWERVFPIQDPSRPGVVRPMPSPSPELPSRELPPTETPAL